MSKIYSVKVSDEVFNDFYTNSFLTELNGYFLRENDFYELISETDTKEWCIVKDQKLIKMPDLKILREIKGENIEQKLYLAHLLNDDVTCVIATGSAGSGKTLLACAYAYASMKEKKYQRFIISRVPVSPSKKFCSGHLKGSLEEKMAPWMRVFYEAIDKIKVLTGNKVDVSVEEFSLEFLKGFTWDDAVIIIDECEDLTTSELKSILTRVGKHSKIIILGDTDQTTESGCKSALLDTVEAFNRSEMSIKEQKMTGTVNLVKSLRSDFVNLVLRIL